MLSRESSKLVLFIEALQIIKLSEKLAIWDISHPCHKIGTLAEKNTKKHLNHVSLVGLRIIRHILPRQEQSQFVLFSYPCLYLIYLVFFVLVYE